MFGEESGASVGCRREGSVVDDRMVRRYDGHVGEAKETPADGAHGGSEKDTGRGLRFEGARLGTSPFDVSVGAKDATEPADVGAMPEHGFEGRLQAKGGARRRYDGSDVENSGAVERRGTPELLC